MRAWAVSITFAGLAYLAACGGPQSDPEPRPTPRPAFDFRGLKPGTTTVNAAKKDGIVEDCRSDPKNEFSCSFAKYQVGDVGFGESFVIFRDGKFDWFLIRFSTDSFEALRRVLMQVYGDPCEVDSKPLQNAFGAQFSGDEVQWCFAEGNMKLRRHDKENVTRGELNFFTDHPEDAKPEATFNSTTL